ncbi:MAG: ParB/RepB/Spo0J family partition protein [Candidatus Latescibacteria bacterium]|nr:ParB/RepB/Spo0J family partition protein [Candidatus Latescibacterota bacterium]
MSKKALGKGIYALLPQSPDKIETEPDLVQYLDVNIVKPNPYQPRMNPQEDLSDLVASIREKGVIQPILVRTRKEVNTDTINYELVVGERRLRAAREAGLEKIPAIIKELTEIEMVEWALIENIQRANLNIIEEALAYKRLMEDFSMTHEMIADKVGKNRSTITNALRLLTLPETIRNYILQNKISFGHARALLSLTDRKLQEQICDRIINEGLSVRDAEALCMPNIKTRTRLSKTIPQKRQPDVHLVALQEQLQDYLRTKVNISKRAQKGVVSIEFYSDDDLTRLIKLITGNNTSLK